jgi:tetratricopeptide (TPR) repeat protein
LLIVSGASFVSQLTASSPTDTADRLWREGRATEAFHLFTQFDSKALSPTAQLRLAGLALERGACGQAELLSAKALQRSPAPDDAALAHLTRGACAARRNQFQRADLEWHAIPAPSPYHTLALVLRGEAALQRGDQAAALADFRTALHQPLPQPWTAFVHLRMALLLSRTDPGMAWWHVTSIPTTMPAPDPTSRPFLPLHPSEIASQARSLEAILVAPAEQQPQLLGQHLLEMELYRLALEHFELVDLNKPDGPRAHAYAAYSRYLLGQHDAAIAALRELAARRPHEPAVATMYALLVLTTGDVDAATQALDLAETQQPLDPAFALVRSDVLAAEHRYAEAIGERRRARDIAPPAQHGRYALALAQQHLALTYDLCRDGVAAAQEATTLSPHNSDAWHTLAAAYFHCGSYNEGLTAARQGLKHAPDDPALLFFLGAALWEHGDPDVGRSLLLRAADRAPGSQWRARAEQTLNMEDEILKMEDSKIED